MNPITHALSGWCVAESAGRLGRRERLLVTLAAVAPDVDGFGAIPELLTRNSASPLFWWTDYHHILAHNLLFAVLFAGFALAVARVRRVSVAVLAFVAVHVHLLGDLVGSRGPDGYDWPIPYLYPFSSAVQLTWSGQWALNAWQNVAITCVFLVVTFWLAWSRGYSPVGLVSERADRAVVGALRQRFRKGA
jgi:membrane-bound metal-dependent hydrolase YbcI (DUF457 family)